MNVLRKKKLKNRKSNELIYTSKTAGGYSLEYKKYIRI